MILLNSLKMYLTAQYKPEIDVKPDGYPEKLKGETGFDYRVRCEIWNDEQKSKK